VNAHKDFSICTFDSISFSFSNKRAMSQTPPLLLPCLAMKDYNLKWWVAWGNCYYMGIWWDLGWDFEKRSKLGSMFIFRSCLL
jgi:hypothetical protein